jgi:hypothetical protein
MSKDANERFDYLQQAIELAAQSREPVGCASILVDRDGDIVAKSLFIIFQPFRKCILMETKIMFTEEAYRTYGEGGDITF